MNRREAIATLSSLSLVGLVTPSEAQDQWIDTYGLKPTFNFVDEEKVAFYKSEKGYSFMVPFFDWTKTDPNSWQEQVSKFCKWVSENEDSTEVLVTISKKNNHVGMVCPNKGSALTQISYEEFHEMGH